jgi:hypothetical protein
VSVTAIRAALEGALAAMSPALSTAYENVTFTPVAGTPYQAVAILLARPSNTENAPSHLEQGFVQVTLRYPLNTGPAAAAARAELIRAAFPRGRTLTSGGINTTISDTPEITPGSVDGDRWAVPVRIRFFAHIVG